MLFRCRRHLSCRRLAADAFAAAYRLLLTMLSFQLMITDMLPARCRPDYFHFRRHACFDDAVARCHAMPRLVRLIRHGAPRCPMSSFYFAAAAACYADAMLLRHTL